jgi:hypothetical protein
MAWTSVDEDASLGWTRIVDPTTRHEPSLLLFSLSRAAMHSVVTSASTAITANIFIFALASS